MHTDNRRPAVLNPGSEGFNRWREKRSPVKPETDGDTRARDELPRIFLDESTHTIRRLVHDAQVIRYG